MFRCKLTSMNYKDYLDLVRVKHKRNCSSLIAEIAERANSNKSEADSNRTETNFDFLKNVIKQKILFSSDFAAKIESNKEQKKIVCMRLIFYKYLWFNHIMGLIIS